MNLLSPMPSHPTNFIVILTLIAAMRCAADTVILFAGDDNTGTIEVSGEIADFTGRAITLRRPGASDREYPAGRVKRIDTKWPDGFDEGTAELEAGHYSRAAQRLAEAARGDQRAWVRRLAMARLMECYASAGDRTTAGRLLVELVRNDPTTTALEHAPLAWYATDGVPPAAVDEWLASANLPAAQLLGASHALAGSEQAQALAILKQLERSGDSRLARLAEMQSWRAQIVTATPRDIARYDGRLRDLPESLQAGGWLVLGDMHRHRREFDDAALAYLRCQLLAKHDPPLAATALGRAAGVLATAGHDEESARLSEQLARQYPQTAAAREVHNMLQSP